MNNILKTYNLHNSVDWWSNNLYFLLKHINSGKHILQSWNWKLCKRLTCVWTFAVREPWFKFMQIHNFWNAFKSMSYLWIYYNYKYRCFM